MRRGDLHQGIAKIPKFKQGWATTVSRIIVDYLKHPLDGCFERIRRASEHLASLKDLVEQIHFMQVHALGIELDPKPPHLIKEVRMPAETYMGMRLPVLIGEIAYNLRSALDYLVFELAKLDSGSEQSGTQFPIEDDPSRFEGNVSRFLKGVNSRHVAAIERLQPYNGCDWMGRLRDLSNPDKHRHFIKGSGDVHFTVHSSLEKDLCQITGYERYAHHPVVGHVKVKVHVAAKHTFTDDGAPVIDAIEEIKAQISNAIESFKFEFLAARQ
jgi:hypothetical protein